MAILAFCLSQQITSQLSSDLLKDEQDFDFLMYDSTIVRRNEKRFPRLKFTVSFNDVVSKLCRQLGPTSIRAHHAGLSIIRYFLPFIGNTVCVQCKDKAQRDHFGGRCQGHETDRKRTRFNNVLTPKCHGKFLFNMFLFVFSIYREYCLCTM